MDELANIGFHTWETLCFRTPTCKWAHEHPRVAQPASERADAPAIGGTIAAGLTGFNAAAYASAARARSQSQSPNRLR